MMMPFHRVAEKTLAEISRQIAADSVMFAGRLAPAGARARRGVSDLFVEACAGAPASDDYRFALEYIFEGYLLHFGSSRLLAPDSAQFNLLAGDYMYARGLTHIAALKDAGCVQIMASLISICAHINGVLDAPGKCTPGGDGESIHAWMIAVLMLARRAAGDDSELARMELYRETILANYTGKKGGEVEAVRDSNLEWLRSAFPNLGFEGWFDELALLD